MDLNVLKTFLAVCEYSGFSAAAEKLGYSQSTVSSQIRQLETELDTKLFDRIRHNTHVTKQGEIVQKYVKEILALKQKMENELHQSEQLTGELRLAMADSVCSHYFAEDYLRFQEKYPGISLKIIAAETERMFDMLRKNEVDIVFTLDSHIFDSEFIICGESLVQTHFVAASNHPLAKEKTLHLSDLKDIPFYLTERHMSYRKLFDERLAAEAIEILPVLEIGNTDQICSILKNSPAISFLPDYVTDEFIKSGSLVYLPVEDFEVAVWNQILIHKNKWCSPAMEALIDFYKEVI